MVGSNWQVASYDSALIIMRGQARYVTLYIKCRSFARERRDCRRGNDDMSQLSLIALQVLPPAMVDLTDRSRLRNIRSGTLINPRCPDTCISQALI